MSKVGHGRSRKVVTSHNHDPTKIASDRLKTYQINHTSSLAPPVARADHRQSYFILSHLDIPVMGEKMHVCNRVKIYEP